MISKVQIEHCCNIYTHLSGLWHSILSQGNYKHEKHKED